MVAKSLDENCQHESKGHCTTAGLEMSFVAKDSTPFTFVVHVVRDWSVYIVVLPSLFTIFFCEQNLTLFRPYYYLNISFI
jgi:hypothetical protein